MLSCVMRRGQTSRYSTGGSRRVSGGVGLCESTHTMPLSVWTTQAAMVRYSLTYPVTTPFTTRYAPGLQKQWGGGASAYFFFQAELGLLREKKKKARLVTLWSNLLFLLWQTELHPSKTEHYPPVLGTWNHMKRTCTLARTHVVTCSGRTGAHAETVGD